MAIIIREDTIISSDTTYTDSIQVASGATLTVQSGVTLNLGGNSLLNYGTLELIGSGDNLATIKNGTYSNDSTSGVFNSNLGKIESLTIDSFFNDGRLDFDSTVIINSNVEAYENTNINNSLFQNSPFEASGTASSVVVTKTTFKDSQVEIGAWSGPFQGSATFTQSNFINDTRSIYLNPFFSGNGYSHNINLIESYISASAGSTFEDMVFDADDDLQVNTNIGSSGLIEEPYMNTPEGFSVGGYSLSSSDLGYTSIVPLPTEIYTGTSGNDLLVGFSGYGLMDGGSGVDEITYSVLGSSASFFLNTDNQLVVSGTLEQSEILTSVERIQFTDKAYALDTDGNAGIAAKVIITTFGAGSIGDYMAVALSLVDDGTTLEELCDLVVNLNLIDQVTGSSSNESFVGQVFENVVGRAPNLIESPLYTGYLDNGTYTKSSLLALAANTTLTANLVTENSIDLIGVAGSADGEMLAIQYDLGLV